MYAFRDFIKEIMNTMIVFTSLFFNKKGNQSFYETIKEYSKYYHVVIITSYHDDEYFYDLFELDYKVFDNIEIFRTPQLLYRVLKKFIKRNNNNNDDNNNNSNSSIEIINTKYTIYNFFYYYYSSFFQFLIFLFFRTARKIKNVEIVCAYEIGGVLAALLVKKISIKSKLIAKMQGTVLINLLNNNNRNIKDYYLDYIAYKKLKYFDHITMTNDGTHGDIVLNYFGVDKNKIIFLPNGISSTIINTRLNFKNNASKYIDIENDKIHLMTLSRLISWKRVDLAIEVANVLANEKKVDSFILDIYGFGTQDEILRLKKLINKYKLENNVNIKGPINYDYVPDILLTHDILLSLYKDTNVTNAVLEAAYLNMPIITIKNRDLLSILNIDNEDNNIFLFDEFHIKELIYDIADFINKINITELREKSFKLRMRNNNHAIYSWEDRVKIEISQIINKE